MGRRAVLIASVAAGFVVELAIQAWSGRKEAWDSEEYWTIGLPCLLVFSAAMGFFSRGRAWLWTVVIIPSQVTAMVVRSGAIGALWPLAAALSAVLSTPLVAAAFIGSRLHRATMPPARPDR